MTESTYESLDEVTVERTDEETIRVNVGSGKTYLLLHDPYTDDWLVTIDDPDEFLARWILTREGATQYALEQEGVIEDGEYNYAPDRC